LTKETVDFPLGCLQGGSNLTHHCRPASNQGSLRQPPDDQREREGGREGGREREREREEEKRDLYYYRHAYHVFTLIEAVCLSRGADRGHVHSTRARSVIGGKSTSNMSRREKRALITDRIHHALPMSMNLY